MDRDLIKQLIEALAASDLAELEYRSNGGETLRLVKRATAGRAASPSAQLPVAAIPVAPPPVAPAARTIVAPLYGIVHLQQSPGAPSFVTPGQSVAAGDVVCVIEAMKAFNQVRAEQAGVIAAVLVQSGQEVEAGQPLFELS
jgi:acetyl-CoA carboxylase biotin carboxyl carrier protein